MSLVQQQQLQTDLLYFQKEFIWFYSIMKQSHSSAIPLTLQEKTISKHTLEGMTDKHKKVHCVSELISKGVL